MRRVNENLGSGPILHFNDEEAQVLCKKDKIRPRLLLPYPMIALRENVLFISFTDSNTSPAFSLSKNITGRFDLR
jgi:hypothetical protein